MQRAGNLFYTSFFLIPFAAAAAADMELIFRELKDTRLE